MPWGWPPPGRWESTDFDRLFAPGLPELKYVCCPRSPVSCSNEFGYGGRKQPHIVCSKDAKEKPFDSLMATNVELTFFRDLSTLEDCCVMLDRGAWRTTSSGKSSV